MNLDDSLADAHTSLAFVEMHYEWKFREAERGFKRAIDLDPNYSIAHQWYVFDLVAMGRLDEAVAEIERARQTDPLSAIVNTDAAEILYFDRNYDEALRQAMPVRLVVFGSQKEYEPYRINEFATAYYHQIADRDYIVMSHGGADTFPIAVHEYVHLLVRHFGLKLPPWLNEGLAELYSTLKPMGGKILVGDLIPGRQRALLQDRWVLLAVIFTIGTVNTMHSIEP
ncbi:MAG: hypothetical protein ABSH32_11720 [Bryobacteraceae bacterium]